MSSTGINLHSGDIMQVSITYVNSTLQVTITDTHTNASATQTYNNVDIPALVGGNAAYVGFTAADETFTATQDILSWAYSSVVGTPPTFVGLPAPGEFGFTQGPNVPPPALSIARKSLSRRFRQQSPWRWWRYRCCRRRG